MLIKLVRVVNKTYLVLFTALAMIILAQRAIAWEIPTGVANSDVVVGYLYNESDLGPTATFFDLLISGEIISVDDLDGAGNFTIPDGKLFLAGTRVKNITASVITTLVSMEAAGTYTEEEGLAASAAQQFLLVQEQKATGTVYSAAAHLYFDFAPVRQMALAASPDPDPFSDASFAIALMIPSGPMLVTQEDLDDYVENVVAAGASQFGLKPDDPGLREVLATVPTTYDPTASANTGPTADAGADQSVATEEAVTLDGTASTDPDVGDTLTYAWTQTDGETVTLSDATAASPTFTAPTLGANDPAETLTFSLVVTDDKSNASVADTVVITVDPPANTGPIADAGADQTVDSGESVTLDGSGSSDPDVGDTLTYAWTQTNGGTVTLSDASAASPTFTAPTLGANDPAETLTFSLVVTDDKSNASVADTVVITVDPQDPTPASALEIFEDEVRAAVQDQAVRDLQSGIVVNQKLTREARERFISERMAMDGEQTGAANVPFDVNGTLDASGTTISTKGTFSGAQTVGDGTQRMMFGDFDVQRDGETGSNTATMTGRIAWERMIGDQTLLGYFVGGELAHSNISGAAFGGKQNRVGVTVGGYGVHEIGKNTYVDGFVTLGAGRNNLEIANGVLKLDSDYITQSVTFGGALSSVIEKAGYEIWPELSFSYGRTWIGDIDFTGAAYGLVDNTLSLDAGSVTLANIMFRPEFLIPLDGLASAESLQLFSFAPRLICEQIKATVTEENCGGGAEVGFSGKSADGMSTYSAKMVADRLGNRTNAALQLNLEHRF